VGACLAFITLKEEQFANFGEGKSQLLGGPNEKNLLNILRIEQAKSAFRPCRMFEESLFFVESNGIDA
jgi:hypothetical protein